MKTSTREPRVEWDETETGALTPAEKLHVALEPFESGVAMMREKAKREYRSESAERIEERLRAWIRHRPGAEDGDCVGRRIDPRTRSPWLR